MTGITEERDAAFAIAEEAATMHRYAIAVIHDTMPTPAEAEARHAALIECLDGAES